MFDAVAIYFDGKNAYQSNFGGENSVESFFNDMEKKKVVWAKLFSKKDGEWMASYSENNFEVPA